MSNVNKPKNISDLLKNNSEFSVALKNIIDDFKKLNKENLDTPIMNLLEELLNALSGSIDNFPSLLDLSEAHQKLLFEELKKIISALSSISMSEEEALEYIVNEFLKSFNSLSKTKEQEKDNFTLTEKDKKRIKEELERIAIYEEYKAMNPHRIAGETKLENFINNMKIGGLKHASKYEGGKDKDLKGYSPDFIKDLEQAHKNNKSKGRGGR